jgi:nitrogenase molybdenum-iron protein beta chain
MSNITENPRGGCVLSGVSATLAAIKGLCPVFHAGPGCCMQTTAAINPSLEISSVSVPCSNMLEKEVVFGGLNKLETTVQGAIEVMDAEAYFILTGCTAGIIGDDVESVAEKFRSKGYAVYAIDTPGFAGDTNLGYEIAWNNLIDQVVEEREKDDKLVNVFGIIPGLDPFWRGNLEEITRLLKKLGLKVNTFFRDFQGLDEVKNSSAAALNIIVNPWLFKGPAEKYEEKFGVPYVRIAGLPIGATDTNAFLRTVGEKLNLDKDLVEGVIKEEEDYLYSYLERGIGILGWKRIAVVGDANISVGITRYLANDYSLIPRVVIISEPIFRQSDKDRIIEQLSNLEYAKAPDVYFESDQFKINEIIRKYDDISLFIGSSNDREEALHMDTWFSELTFPITSKFIFNKTIVGYKGSLTLIEELFSNL